MKLTKKFSSLLFATLTAMTTILPVQATEVSPTSESVESVLNVSVVGNGSVEVIASSDTYDVDASNPLEISLPENMAITLNANTDGEIVDVTKNGETLSVFKAGKSAMSFNYITTRESVDFVFTFKDKVAEETKEEEATTQQKTENSDKQASSSEQESVTNTETKSDDEELGTSEELKEDGITIDFSVEELPTEKEQQILEDYQNGIDKKEYKALRKEKAEETGLTKFVDENYFLTDKYYEKYSPMMLTFDHAFILDRTLTKDYQEEAVKAADPDKKMKAPRAMSVIDYSEHTIYNGVGYAFNGLWRMSNNNLAFCANGMMASPMPGDTASDPIAVNNANLRKALYYGYGGPGDRLTGRYGTSGAIVITDELVSLAYSGQCNTQVAAGGYHWRTLIAGLWNEITSQPDPAGYTAYISNVNGMGTNWAGQWVGKQPLTWGEYNPTGELQISKVSANPDITNGNSCYKLEGAQYGVYRSDADARVDKNRVGTLTIGANGWSNTISGLTASTYYLKEVKAPQGYALDTKVHSVTVNGGAKATMEMKDNPQSDPVGVLLGKIDKETNANKPQGSASLANAQFTVKYYKGLYDSDPAKQGVSPARTWVLKTDADGYTELSDAYKVSGDAFYYNGTNAPTLPVGTITIQETKAPEGYYINNEVFVEQITSEGSAENVFTYNAPKIPEQVIKFRIHKQQDQTATAIPGVVFVHTKPDGSTEDLKTDNLGNIEIVGLATGRHSIQEKSVPDGYEINPTKVEFEVKSGGEIVILTDLTDTGISTVKETDGNTLVTVTDEVSPFDFKIVKINDHDKMLDGAEFTLYSNPECTQVVDVQTTKDGTLTFETLEDRTNYYFKETKAPQGYRIPIDPLTKQPHVYRVYVESTPAQGKFNFWIDNVMYTVNNTNPDDAIHLEGTKKDRVISVEIVNYVGLKLPETGSNATLFLVIAGLGLMSFALYKKSKKSKLDRGE